MKQLKVMSFNLKRNYFSGGSRCFYKRKEAIREVICKYNPDIIGTQELTSKSLKEMEAVLTEYHCVGNGRGGGNKGEYTAIFYKKSKFTLHEEYTFWLSPTPDRPSRAWLAFFPRICTTCVLTFKDEPSESIRLFNTHLDHISYLARLKGLELITHIIQQSNKEDNTPTLVMGDFNATPTSKTMRDWQKKLVNKGKVKLQSTYNKLENRVSSRSYHGFVGKTKGSPIDYIFVTENIEIEEVQICRDQIEGYFPSDHYPVLATIHV